jgi:hypothetical protein
MTSADNGVGTPAYIKGVPHPLPAGERLLWEGAPDVFAVAAHVFHWKLLAGYFVAMLAWWVASTTAVFASKEFAAGLFVAFVLSVGALLIAWVLATAVASTSWYAITSKRVVLRVGMVFPMSINVPFTIIESAGLGAFKDGSGQLVIKLIKGQRIAYIALWPHCRVFRFSDPEPVLRGLAQPSQVASILSSAVAEFASTHGTPLAVQSASTSTSGIDSAARPMTVGA